MDIVKPVKEFIVDINGVKKPILECDLNTPNMRDDTDDLELSEYLAKVEWIKTNPREEAYRESGLFANQNTVCKLRNQFTLDKLITFFDLEE